MKNKSVLFLVSLVSVFSIILGANAFYLQCQEQAVDGGDKVLGNVYSPERVICGGASATTTLTYLTTTGASSTCYAFVSDADRVDLKWITTASSTSSVLNWRVYFSDEDEPSEQTWYAEKNYTTTNNYTTTYSDLATTRTMTLSAGGTAYHSTSVENSNDRWLKVEYGVAGANAGVHLEILPKNHVE